MRYPASQTAEKHERILKEAARLFREHGFDGAGVAKIMKAAGRTHGSFYAHFPSKDALEAEAVERAFAQSNDRIYALTANAGDPKRGFLDPTPHFGPTLRMSLVEVDEGRVVCSGEPVDAFANPFGSVHGGWMAPTRSSLRKTPWLRRSSRKMSGLIVN